MGGIKLGRVLGFDISIDWSWLLIFFLVVFTLASGYYPLNHPEFSVTLDWELAIISALLLFAAVLVHELSSLPGIPELWDSGKRDNAVPVRRGFADQRRASLARARSSGWLSRARSPASGWGSSSIS